MNLIRQEKRNERNGKPRRTFFQFHEEPHDLYVICDYRAGEAYAFVQGDDGNGGAFELPPAHLTEAQAQRIASGFYTEWLKKKPRRTA